MENSISIGVFLILSCCLRDGGAKSYDYIIAVENGGPWGYWGKKEFCPQGHASGFVLKVNTNIILVLTVPIFSQIAF